MSLGVVSRGIYKSLGIEKEHEIVRDGHTFDGIFEAKVNWSMLPLATMKLIMNSFAINCDEVALTAFTASPNYLSLAQSMILLQINNQFLSCLDVIFVVVPPNKC